MYFRCRENHYKVSIIYKNVTFVKGWKRCRRSRVCSAAADRLSHLICPQGTLYKAIVLHGLAFYVILHCASWKLDFKQCIIIIIVKIYVYFIDATECGDERLLVTVQTTFFSISNIL